MIQLSDVAYYAIDSNTCAEACRLAINLARNAIFAVFPCRDDNPP